MIDEQENDSHTKIGVRESTKRKLTAVKEAKDWSYATTVDKAADALLEKEGISAPGSTEPEKQPVA